MRRTCVLAIALLAAGCAAKSAPVTKPEAPAAAPAQNGALPPPTPGPVAQRFTERDTGKRVDVAVGTRFSVDLVGVPTAGYLWKVVSRPAFLSEPVEIGGDTHANQAKPGFVGGNHWEVFGFEVTGSGEGRLVLEMRRPWEKTEPASRTFVLTVTAK